MMWLLLVLLITAAPAVAAEPVSEEALRPLINAGECRAARLLIEHASNRDAFLGTPKGKAIYAASLCFSDPKELEASQVSSAITFTELARTEFSRTTPPPADWIDWTIATGAQCTRLLQQAARGQGGSRRSEYAGKIGGRCGQNPSSDFLRWATRPRNEGEVLQTFTWTPILPALPGGTPSAEKPPAPPAALMAGVAREHVESNARVAACAPFLVVSSTQDPATVCVHATDFLGYFRRTYAISPPAGWITIHHYSTGPALERHAQALGGPACRGLFGYYDFRRQAVAFWAPAGSYGTLQHEMTHALFFWDFPLAPRWFEEGLAALYENTDRRYVGLPNPWREEILRRVRDPEARFFDTVLPRGTVEFELEPEPATLARAIMMKIQVRGHLPRLYEDLRSQVAGNPGLAMTEVVREGSPGPARVAEWKEMVRRALQQ